MIRLQFSRQADFASDAIAWFSSGHLSHVDAVMGNGFLLGSRSDVVEHIPAGVQIRPPWYARFAEKVVFEIPATPFQYARWERFLEAQIGKPYDSTAIWGFVTGRDWREQDSWFCSELQARALEVAGVAPNLYLAANKITPVALALAVSAMGAHPALTPQAC